MGRYCRVSPQDLCALVLLKKVIRVHVVLEMCVCVRQHIHYKLSLKISAGSSPLIPLDEAKITPLFWELHNLSGEISPSLKFLGFKSTCSFTGLFLMVIMVCVCVCLFLELRGEIVGAPSCRRHQKRRLKSGFQLRDSEKLRQPRVLQSYSLHDSTSSLVLSVSHQITRTDSIELLLLGDKL